MIKLNRPAVFPFLAAVVWLFSICNVQPQEGSVEGVPIKTAFLRGWIFPSANGDELALVAIERGSETQRSLAASQEATVVAAPIYAAVAEGPVSLELRSGDRVLAQAQVALRAEKYYTVAAWNSGGTWEIKAFADGPPAPGAADRPLRVFNFAGERETIVSVDGRAGVEVKQQSVVELKAAPKVCMVTVEVLATDGGAPAQSAVEVDVAFLGSVYVVVGPDYRGRMRPRVINGWEKQVEESLERQVPADAQR